MSVPAAALVLDLAPHPEGGWYRRTWTSNIVVDTPAGPRPSATAVLYLLDGVSRWHRVRSAELWCWHRGSAIELRSGGTGDAPSPDANLHRLDGDTPQLEVPARTWQTARLLGPDPALVTCVVSPGFDFADFELAPALTAAAPRRASLADQPSRDARSVSGCAGEGARPAGC